MFQTVKMQLRVLQLSRASMILMISILILTVKADSTIEQVQSQSKEKRSEEIAAGIKKTARQLVESQSLIIKKTEFISSKETKSINYRLGGVRTDLLGLNDDDPYELAFEKQIHVEALRALFSKALPAQTFWRKFLDKIENLIFAYINEIESTSELQKQQEISELTRKEIFQQMKDLKQAIKQYAEGMGFSADESNRGLASDSFSVLVNTDPPGGRVKILPYVKYVQCNVLMKCGENWHWRELVSKEENLIGTYFYIAEWANGRKNDGRIEVRNTTPITFRPKE